MKKLFAVLMTLALVLSMGTIAFAADESTPTGTITITNAVPGETYNIYKMLDFEPVTGSTDKGVYTVADRWDSFFQSATTNYFEVELDENDRVQVGAVVRLKDGVNKVDQELIKIAFLYTENMLYGVATESKVAEGSTVVFEGLDLGYYLIETTVGTFGALTNTNSEFTAVEKNEKPDITKEVLEDGSYTTDTDNVWGKVNDASIGEKVNYKSIVTVGAGITNYTMHDTMEAGLTFNNDVIVKLADGTVVDAANYTVTVSPTDGHTFDVEFNNTFIAGLEKGTQFEVYYSATLNENANIVTDGNDNTVYLSYGEDNTTTAEHKTTTYTWKLEVFKFTMEGENKTGLAGAKFQLIGDYADYVYFVEVENTEIPTYQVVSKDTDGAIWTIETDKDGKFEIIGLDKANYALVEAEAPAGYNKIDEYISAIITSEYDEEALTASYKINDADPAIIEVENKTGGLLPETGGIGTTIFYVVGGMLMVAAVVFLVTKKRMAAFA